MQNYHRIGITLLALIIAAPLTWAVDFDRQVNLTIAAQPLSTALVDFSKQAQIQVISAEMALEARRAGELKGRYSVRDALTKLLEGTGLAYSSVGANTIAVMAMGAMNGGGGEKEAGVRMAQAGGSPENNGTEAGAEGNHAAGAEAQEAGTSKGATSKEGEGDGLEEVVVTGTHIRGIDYPVGSQLITINEREISEAGYFTVQDMVRSLPQNFGGGVSEDTSAGPRAANPAKGTAFDLRGLGYGATLTLLNGRRLAGSGQQGSFTDVSSIPVTAIERIEILPDGASALYGSDAVGGVVNIILKKQYDGATTQARIGSVTNGPLQDYLFGQNIGANWNDGNALIALEYRQRDALPAEARREMDSDWRSRGGLDLRTTRCNPGTLVIGSQTYAVPRGQDGTSLTAADLTPGTSNSCNRTVGADILAGERLVNAFGTLRHGLSTRAEAFLDLAYARRTSTYGVPSSNEATLVVPSTNPFYVSPIGGSSPVTVRYNFVNDFPAKADYRTQSVNAAAGAIAEVGNNWQLKAQAGVSNEEQNGENSLAPDPALLEVALADPDPATAFNPFGDGSHSNAVTLERLRGSQVRTYSADSSLRSFNLSADGPLLRLPAGEVKFAVGAEHWNHSLLTQTADFRRSSPTLTIHEPTEFDRRVSALFAEVLVPIFGEPNRRSGLAGLEVSIAGRYEDYSDYGDAAVPRIGLRWSPAWGLSFRGAWSKSFNAPQATDLVEANNSWFIIDLPAPSGVGTVATLLWDGANADLEEETATIRTAGIDWKAPASAGSSFSVGVSFFDIEFTNRIDRLTSLDLEDPALAAALTMNPTAAQRADVCASPSGGNFSSAPGDCLTAAVDVLYDQRINNFAAVNERGVDLLATFTRETAYGDLSGDLNMTYILKFEQQQTRTAPSFDIVDTANNPLAFRLRGSVGWSRRGAAVRVFVNHADGYKFRVDEPDRRVSSWTTLDLNAAYDFQEIRSESLRNLSLSINVQNVLDQGPPFYSNPSGIGYDPENADLLRRFASFQVRKQW